MRKLSFSICCLHFGICQWDSTFNLPHQNLSIAGYDNMPLDYEKEVFAILKRYPVKMLKMNGYGISEEDYMICEVDPDYLSNEWHQRTHKIDLPKLTHLSLDQASVFINRLGQHRIEKLILSGFDLYVDHIKWNEFFHSCEHLKEVKFHRVIYTLDLTGFSFKLKSLEYTGKIWQLSSDKAQIKDNVEAHRETLRNLTFFWEDFDLFKFAIFELQLEKLSCDLGASGKFEELQGNETIKTLLLRCISGSDYEYIKKAFMCFQVVEKFHIEFSDSYEGTIMNALSISMPKLKVLTLNFIDYYISDEVEELLTSSYSINHVETLIVKTVPKNSNRRVRFMTSCPNVKKLEISEGYLRDKKLPSEEFKFILESLKKLEEFVVHGIVEFNDEIFALISSSNLRVIKIFRNYSQNDEDFSEIIDNFKNLKTQLMIDVESSTTDYFCINFDDNEEKIFDYDDYEEFGPESAWENFIDDNEPSDDED